MDITGQMSYWSRNFCTLEHAIALETRAAYAAVLRLDLFGLNDSKKRKQNIVVTKFDSDVSEANVGNSAPTFFLYYIYCR